MLVKVKLFSVARDLAGFSEREIDVEHNSTTQDVLKFLEQHNLQFREWKSSLRFAVNYEYVQGNHPLREGDEVAVIPPVSGG
jgi:molybdopterin converting factor subunit 1